MVKRGKIRSSKKFSTRATYLDKYSYVCTVRSHNIEPKGIIDPCNEVDVRAYGVAGVFCYLKIYIMNEIYLQCQFNDKDEMIVSKGDYICFEIIEGEDSKTVCIDSKQAYTLIKTLEHFSNERLD